MSGIAIPAGAKGVKHAKLNAILSLIRSADVFGIGWTTLCDRAYEQFGISESEMDELVPVLEDEWGAICYYAADSKYYALDDFRR